MKKILLGWFFVSTLATAAVEMRAIAIQGFNLYKGPNDDYGVSGEMVKPGDELYVIGSSVGGLWLRVANAKGVSGWIPAAQVKLERVTAAEVHDVQLLMDQGARFKSLIQLDMGLSSGSMPFGKGLSIAGTLNFAPSGVLGVNTDQVEFGALLSYHLGREVFGYVTNDETKYHLNESGSLAFLSYGLFGQWLFRSGDRGAFMIGPRGGFLVTKFNYGNEYHYPLMAGVVMRYFSGENLGYSASAIATIDTSFYFFYTFGISLRF